MPRWYATFESQETSSSSVNDTTAQQPAAPPPLSQPAKPRKFSARELLKLLLFGVCLNLVIWGWIRYSAVNVDKFALAHLRGSTAAPRLDGTHPCISARIINGAPVPSLTHCATPTTHSSVDIFEVDLRYGYFILRQTDLQLTDDLAFPFTRAYSSGDWDQRPHAFGLNTSHVFDACPEGTRNPYTYMVLKLEDADFLYLPRISPGTGFANAVFQHTETSTSFYKTTINWNGNGWTLRLTDGTQMYFPEAYNAKNTAQGAATEIRYASGSRLHLERNSRRDLETIRTEHGRTIRLTYDDYDRIIRAEDDKGNWVRYGYAPYGDSMLIYAIDSSGRERHYSYDGVLMTGITDEHGTMLVRNTYSPSASHALVRQEYPNGDVYQFRYNGSPDNSYAESVTVTLPNHREVQIPTSASVSEYLTRHIYRGQ